MANSKSTASSGIGIGTLLFLVFLVLKLAEIGQVAKWSWWWVTSPLWIPIAAVIVVILAIALFTAVINFIDDGIYYFNQKKENSQTKPPVKSKFQQRLETMAEERRKNKSHE